MPVVYRRVDRGDAYINARAMVWQPRSSEMVEEYRICRDTWVCLDKVLEMASWIIGL